MRTDVVIIGGGLAGLTCAVGLRESGLNVVLIERSAVLGGRARSMLDATTGDVVDIGPHIFLTDYANMFQLLDILGTRDRIVWQKDKFITLVDRQQPVVMRTNGLPPPMHYLPTVHSLRKAPSLSPEDVDSNGRVGWLAMKLREEDLLRLDALDAYSFLRDQGVSQRFIEWFWATVSMSITNVPVQRCSAGALLRFYRRMLWHNDIHVGFAGAGLGDLFAPQAAQLLESSGARILLSTEVKAFTNLDGVATGVVLANGEHIHARYCVAAVPPQALQPLLPRAWVERHGAFKDLGDFQPSPYISSYLWFARKLTREQFWARLWSPTNLNYDFYDLSNIRSGWGDRPSLIASNIVYSDRARAMTDDEIIAATVGELADFLPQAARSEITHARVHRIPMAIHCPVPGTEQKRPETRTAIRGLFLAGDWIRTEVSASMESAVRAGWLACEQIWAEIGKPRSFAVPIREPGGLSGLVRRLTHTGTGE